MKKLKFLLATSLCAALVGFSSCSEESSISEEPVSVELKSAHLESTGKLRIKLKSSNIEGFDDAQGYLDFIQLRASGSGAKDPKLVTIWDTGEWFNLLSMETGIMGDIGFLEIPSGLYDQAICHVTDGWVMEDSVKYPCKFPGDQMVLHFSPPILVGEHLSEDLTIVVDVTKSFVEKNDAYNFKPVVKVENNTVAGSLVGGIYNAEGEPALDVIFGQTAYVVLTDGTNTYYGPVFPPMEELGGSVFIVQGVLAGDYTATVVNNDIPSSVSQEVSILEGNFNSAGLVYVP